MDAEMKKAPTKSAKAVKTKSTKHSVHFSSESQTWNTPTELFDKLDAAWGFELDTACLASSALCNEYFTPETDGLNSSWGNKICYNNPPYDNIKGWATKCYNEYKQGATVVQLIPSRTDTKAFQDYVFPYATCVCFIRGRIKFADPTKRADEKTNPAPFPSCIVVFDDNLTPAKLAVLNDLGAVFKKV